MRQLSNEVSLMKLHCCPAGVQRLWPAALWSAWKGSYCREQHQNNLRSGFLPYSLTEQLPRPFGRRQLHVWRLLLINSWPDYRITSLPLNSDNRAGHHNFFAGLFWSPRKTASDPRFLKPWVLWFDVFVAMHLITFTLIAVSSRLVFQCTGKMSLGIFRQFANCSGESRCSEIYFLA